MGKLIKSWKFYLIIGILIAMTMYTVKLFSIHRRLPSEQWSKEVLMAQASFSDSNKLNKDLVSLAVNPNENKLAMFWLDDTTLRYGLFDERGKEIKIEQLGFDAANVTQISSYHINNDEYTVIYIDKNLNSVKLNVETGEIIENKVLSQNVTRFQHHNDKIIYKKGENLIIHNLLSNEANTIFTGEIKYFGIYSDEQYQYAYYEYINEERRFVGQYLQLDDQLNIIEEVQLYDTISLNSYGLYNNMKVENNQLCLVMSKRNLKANNEKVTILTLDVNNPKDIKVEQIITAPSLDKVAITNINKDSVGLLYQKLTPFGTNIMRAVVKDETVIESKILTMTKHASLVPHYFELNGYHYMQWYDITDIGRMIYLSSDNPSVISASIALSTISPIEIILTIIIVFITVLLIGGIFWLVNIVLPIIIVGFSNLIFKKKKWRHIVSYVIGAVSFSALQIYITHKHILGNDYYRTLLPFQSLTAIIILLGIVMLLSTWCAFLWAKENETESSASTFTVFSVIDTLLFSFVILTFVITIFILNSL